MRCHITAPQPQGAEGSFERRHGASRHRASGFTGRSPFRTVLSREDYWQLNDHRLRCEEFGGPRFTRLARLIRETMLDAIITETEELAAKVVTGRAHVTFKVDGRHPETRLLYHWDYPDHQRRPLPVGSFLGVALMGMAVGQRRRVLDGNGDPREVQVLDVHPPGTSGAQSID